MNIIDRASSLRCVGAAATLLVLVVVPAQAQCPDGSPPPCGASAPSSRPALDTDVVAIAPFDVLVPGLELWREGMVDVLSRRLDGAGPLRTVSASAVINGWSGRADPASARRLGRRTRAQYAVFGELVGAGTDSVRISVSVLDVAAGRVTGTSEARNASARMDLLADTLTLRLLAVLGRARGGGVLGVADFDTRSLPALKAYLEGEQLFRQARHDSAAVHFRHAITLDSGFTQARRRLAWAAQWQCATKAPDFSLLDETLLRIAVSKGLTQRDSISLQVDSLFAARRGLFPPDTSRGNLISRMASVTAAAVAAFPRDAEFWHLRGEALLQLRPQTDSHRKLALEAFEQAMEFDPGLAPPFLDAAEIAGRRGEYARAQALVRAYERAGGSGDCAMAARIFADLLPGGLTGAARTRRLANIPAGLFVKVAQMFGQIPDPAETAVALSRVALERRIIGYTTRDTLYDLQQDVQRTLRFRGHLDSADAIPGDAMEGKLARLFIQEAAPSVGPVVPPWTVETAPLDGFHSLGLSLVAGLAQSRDTVALDRLAQRADSLERVLVETPTSAPERYPGERENNRKALAYAAAFIRSGRHLAVHDTTSAIRALELLPNRTCYGCARHVPMLARLYSARAEYEKAATYYSRDLPYALDADDVLWAFERAVVLERIADREGARANYQFVADAWRNPDPPLAPFAEQARQGLRRLR